ncbi:MAG TPA: hypothetical protein GXZ60_15205 [Intrasporangiaceae bacterium]|nr:hypothetical protein [Intrasporangiaceae bacterium]
MSPTTTPSTPGAPSCADTSPPATTDERVPGLFPPKDADEATRRAWLADTPWPEVVFATAR